MAQGGEVCVCESGHNTARVPHHPQATPPPSLTIVPLDAWYEQDGLIVGGRNAGGNVTSFKLAFCTSRIVPARCQFRSFKADFTLLPAAAFTEVFVPWSAFSNRWSASTGKHTAEHPPGKAALQSITQLQLWVEGVKGDFHLQLKYIRAGKKM